MSGALLDSVDAKWLVTGGAGFIGSNVVQRLLEAGQTVTVLDNFSTGHRSNLDEALREAGEQAASRFTLIEGDVRDLATCQEACSGVDYVLHQAALGSVPRSLADPLTSHEVNVGGMVHMLMAAREAGVRRFVYASSSSVYGDHPGLPKQEDQTGRVLSPYAATKACCETYAAAFQAGYGLETIGLRYFNVFGRRQDPAGPYSAVIPRWIDRMLGGERCEIYGDGETSRDFCYVDNAVQANLRAALADASASGAVYNIAFGERTTLNELYEALRDRLLDMGHDVYGGAPSYQPFRAGDVRHSLADVSAAAAALGYAPTHSVADGLDEALVWYASSRATTASG